MARRVRVDGLRELDTALGQLPKATGKNVLRRVLRLAAKPIEQAAEARAPKLTGRLETSINTGTRLNRRQRAMARKAGKSTVEIHVGTADPAGVPQEFGTFKEDAQPFMRPAWDAEKDGALTTIATELGGEIEKAAQRLAKKRARAGGQ